MQQIEEFVPQVDWKTGLIISSQFLPFSFSPSFCVTKQDSLQKVDEISCKLACLEPSSDVTTKHDESSGQLSADCSSHSLTATAAQGDANNRSEQLEKEACTDIATEKRAKKAPKNPLLPSFRATCYRTGEKHSFKSPQVCFYLAHVKSCME